MLNGVPGMVGESVKVLREVARTHAPGTVLARGEEWFAIPLIPGTSIAPDTIAIVADVERGLLVIYPEIQP